jgi:hypothetical protein
MGKKLNFFWQSYSDLMTSLFFVMLVLYALTFVKLKADQRALKYKSDSLTAVTKYYERIRLIDTALSKIDTNFFSYNGQYKKHISKIDIQFSPGSCNINEIPPIQQAALIKAGDTISKFISEFKNEENIRYLVIIEGQASKDGNAINDVLSYNRALSLKKFWEEKGIHLDKQDNCELIVAGSGERGVPRKEPDKPPFNQRFLIYIIPKVGKKMDTNK